MYPKMVCFSNLGCIYDQICIPKLLFQRFGVFLKGKMYPKTVCFCNLGCVCLQISQTADFLVFEIKFNFQSFYDIFAPLPYHKSAIFQDLWYSSNQTASLPIPFSRARKPNQQKYAKSPKSAQKAYNSPTGVCLFWQILWPKQAVLVKDFIKLGNGWFTCIFAVFGYVL